MTVLYSKPQPSQSEKTAAPVLLLLTAARCCKKMPNPSIWFTSVRVKRTLPCKFKSINDVSIKSAVGKGDSGSIASCRDRGDGCLAVAGGSL